AAGRSPWQPPKKAEGPRRGPSFLGTDTSGANLRGVSCHSTGSGKPVHSATRAGRGMRLEPVTQTERNGSAAQVLHEQVVVRVRDVRVQVGALAQVIRVAQAVDVHRGVVAQAVVLGIGALPGSEYL